MAYSMRCACTLYPPGSAEPGVDEKAKITVAHATTRPHLQPRDSLGMRMGMTPLELR